MEKPSGLAALMQHLNDSPAPCEVPVRNSGILRSANVPGPIPLDLRTAALQYASIGWPVFPLLPQEKRPDGRRNVGIDNVTMAPQGLKNATTDAGQIERWWKASPEANIGLATGHCFDVLDIDGEEGLVTYLELTGEHGADERNLPMVSTGSGGLHVYVLPTGHGLRTAMWHKIDWRGAGGYVVAPPSIHPNGTRYMSHEGELGVCSPWILERLAAPAREVAIEMAKREIPELDEGEITRRAMGALKSACEDIANAPQGERNKTLYQQASGIYGLHLRGEIYDEVAMREALAAAARVWGCSEKEINRQLDRAKISDRAVARVARTT